MLIKDFNLRYTAITALNHDWFKNAEEVPNLKIDSSILKCLQNYNAKSQMQKEALAIIVKQLDSKIVKNLNGAFLSMDTSNTGYLSFEEVEAALNSCGLELPKKEINTIIRHADYNSDGRINYSEFIAATLSQNLIKI